jgi:hypothetical protein
MTRSKRAFLALMLAGALGISACGGDDDNGAAAPTQPSQSAPGSSTGPGGTTSPPTTAELTDAEGTTYVGKVEGTDAYIGLVVNEQGATGYICDGEKISHWLRGALDENGQLALTSNTGAALSAKLEGDTLTGSVLIPESSEGSTRERFATAKPHKFEAAEASGDAGLYREEQTIDGAKYVAGWVKLDDGSTLGKLTVPITGDNPPADVEEGTALPEEPPVPAKTFRPIKSSTACITATAQYNLAYKQWDDADGKPGDNQGPLSGTAFNNLSSALFNYNQKCGGAPVER